MATTELFPLSAANSNHVTSFRMIDVGSKVATRRRAVARGTIRLSHEAYVALREKKNPKGDVLALAEVAGIQAVKRVPEAIPLCHSLPIEYARLRFEFSDELFEVTVFCEVGTTSKTGVEMEALAGVNGALLSIYDLCKAVNPVLSMTGVRLDLKEGGKSGRWVHPDYEATEGGCGTAEASTPQFTVSQEASVTATVSKSSITAKSLSQSSQTSNSLQNFSSAVLVVSDRCARGAAEDTSGAHLEKYLRSQGSPFFKKTIVPDSVEQIRSEVSKMVHDLKAQIIFITGGTGVGPRDVTPEALESLFTKRVPGVGELLRSNGAQFTPMSWLSRSEAGFINDTFVVLLPGSATAVAEAVETLHPVLSHLLHVSRGGDHDQPTV